MKRGLFLVLALAYAPFALASAEVPVCLDKQGEPIASPNNDLVAQWKRSTPNGYLDRAYVRGTLLRVYPSKPGHLHLEVALAQTGNPNKANELEVIYNVEFGHTPGALSAGLEVIACGDYITSTEQNGPYPASPVNAILHWVHKAMNNRHESGFLMIGGILYGQENAPARFGYGDSNRE
jgi:hypothetical protein